MMAVSCTKAMLVILFFMHVKYEANWKYVLTIPGRHDVDLPAADARARRRPADASVLRRTAGCMSPSRSPSSWPSTAGRDGAATASTSSIEVRIRSEFGVSTAAGSIAAAFDDPQCACHPVVRISGHRVDQHAMASGCASTAVADDRPRRDLRLPRSQRRRQDDAVSPALDADPAPARRDRDLRSTCRRRPRAVRRRSASSFKRPASTAS